MSKKQIGKKLRFQIFSRDNFSCRYCGRQSFEATLVIGHVIPLSKGGDNHPDNLITLCRDCVAGKSDNIVGDSRDNEIERLRLAQELSEQEEAYERARRAAAAKQARLQLLVNYWCEAFGAKNVSTPTIMVIFSYVQEHGEELVYSWIDSAAIRCSSNSDGSRGRYISGCRRRHKEEMEEGANG